jgi:hypothetical protein
MPVDEKFGRRISEDNAEIVYVARSYDNAGDARAAVASAAPSTYLGLPRRDIRVDELVDEDYWLATALYRKSGRGKPLVGESSYGFDTAGGSSRIQASLATVAAYGAGAATGDNGNLIGVSDDGNVEGTEIVTPVLQWYETHYFAPNHVSNSFRGTLYALTGSVNADVFKGTATDETLFIGAAGSQRGDDPWEITFRFASAPNLTGLTVGAITGIAKKGWEYLWVRYRKEVLAGSTKQLMLTPRAVYVEQVYRAGNFSLLGIGTT